MLCILSPSNNPEFNLAAEEYLFRNFTDDIFFLYVNEPSVVVGKHQNALAEVNPEFVREKGIPVLRRLSGGGAVYHDLGNLNFSFHQNVPDTAKVSFKVFNQPVVEVLQSLDVPAEISERNDIMVKGYKVSGHADHVFRKRVLSHGTLLFNANREQLSQALKNNSGTFSGKAIQSVRSRVANVVDFLPSPLSIEDFVQEITDHIIVHFSDSYLYKLTAKDSAEIEILAREKYSSWEWNYGYSPKYRFEKKCEELSSSIAIQVEKGTITEVKIASDSLTEEQQKAVQQNLLNSFHEYHTILKVLSLPEINRPELISCFF